MKEEEYFWKGLKRSQSISIEKIFANKIEYFRKLKRCNKTGFKENNQS